MVFTEGLILEDLIGADIPVNNRLEAMISHPSHDRARIHLQLQAPAENHSAGEIPPQFYFFTLGIPKQPPSDPLISGLSITQNRFWYEENGQTIVDLEYAGSIIGEDMLSGYNSEEPVETRLYELGERMREYNNSLGLIAVGELQKTVTLGGFYDEEHFYAASCILPVVFLEYTSNKDLILYTAIIAQSAEPEDTKNGENPMVRMHIVQSRQWNRNSKRLFKNTSEHKMTAVYVDNFFRLLGRQGSFIDKGDIQIQESCIENGFEDATMIRLDQIKDKLVAAHRHDHVYF